MIVSKPDPMGWGASAKQTAKRQAAKKGSTYPKDVCKLLFLDCATVFVLTGGVPQGLWL